MEKLDKSKIAIIGAGLAGAWLARKLSDAKFDVTVYEKSRGSGGRTASRTLDDIDIDLGAQFIEANNNNFLDFIKSMIRKDILIEWQNFNLRTFDASTQELQGEILPAFTKLYLPVPKMNILAKSLLENLVVHYSTKISRITDDNQLFDEEDNLLSQYDLVISTAPPRQSLTLFEGNKAFDVLSNIQMSSNYALALLSKNFHIFDYDGLNIQNSLLNWVGINSQKPQRSQRYTSVILHADSAWTSEHLDIDSEEISKKMFSEFLHICKPENFVIKQKSLHRWLYARAINPLGAPYILASNKAACGDYMLGDNLEAAWLSADILANKIINDYS
ncbi:MAG: NAD(P)-binding protein [Candidatus Caenarcaniphilales bacterium]|nr:NAD(P)-binding protein [Candidatus Caenarcaniphilales bacterium]